MRILLSLLRILFGVLLGLGIMFVAIPRLVVWFPGVMTFIFLCSFGALMTWKNVSSLKSGKMAINVKYRTVVYERASFEFWFYILFFGLLGVLAFCGGCYFLFHPPRGHVAPHNIEPFVFRGEDLATGGLFLATSIYGFAYLYFKPSQRISTVMTNQQFRIFLGVFLFLGACLIGLHCLPDN